MYGHPIYVGYVCDHINWSRVGAFNSNFSIIIAFLPQVGLVEYLFSNLKVGVITLTWASQGSEVKNLLQCRCWLDPWFGKTPWRRKWQLISVFLPGKSHGYGILVGYSPWSCKRVRHNCKMVGHNLATTITLTYLLWVVRKVPIVYFLSS